ncbi:hypothetical protein Tco_0199250 [Tanacetum coccineum]
MSSASSAVTYTSVYTDSKLGRVFWGADEEVSDGGPEDPQTPPVPEDEDEREAMFIQRHDPDYVSELIYPEYIPLEDEHEFLAEKQPLLPVDSPTAESPRYVTESDLEEDPEGYEDDETEDGPVDYPMDGGDDRDNDDGDSSRDDADDEEDEEEEEEHPAPADSAVVVPTIEPASISLPPEAEVERLLAMPTPSPSPPISLSPPSTGERLARCTAPPAHLSPPPMPSPLLPSSGCPTQIQTLRIASTQALIDAVTAALPSPPLPPLPPSLYIPPPIDGRDDVPKSELPPCKRLCLSTLDSRYEIGESYNARPTRGDRMTLQETVWVMEEEAYASREAWAHSIGMSQATHQELQTHRDHAEMAALRESDHRHQAQMAETLRVMRNIRREMSDMQAELLAHREQQRRSRLPGPDARIPDH